MKSRIIIDPNICHGKPVIVGTRVLVANILASLAAGESIDKIIDNYPNINKDDISAALAFGSQVTNFETYPYSEKTQ
jgi:uncharacterized protein (DUF433 family)